MTGWWSTEKIRATISREYVERELGTLKNREALHRVLKFGDGLTDNTYLEWILDRSPRFFLILNDLGCPEKIFDVVDRSFDDDDLPLSQDALWELNIFGTKSESLDKKFYRQQFSFLVQDLERGGHVDYGVWEVVPVEPAAKRGHVGVPHNADKVYAYEHLYTRKKIPGGEDGVDRVHFMLHLRSLVSIQHPHLSTVFATYAQDDMYYALLTPSTEMTLKQVFEDQPKQFKVLDKKDRRDIVLTWAHCLTSALAYLHEHGFIHRSIRPSNIIVDQNSKVYLSDFAALKALDCEETPNLYSGEVYDYAPPENWLRKPTLHEMAPLKSTLPGGGRTSRRLPKQSGKPVDLRPPPSPISTSTIANRSTSRSASSSGSSTTTSSRRPRNALITTFAPQRASTASFDTKQYPADIFSLSAVLLTLLSHLLGHSPKTFAAHRCKYNRQAGRGNAPPDASFHKNLTQVSSWMDDLSKEAGHKEKKDVKFWGAVVELVGVCRSGLRKEPGSRIAAADIDKKVGGWVDWGLGRRRRCTCQDEKSSAPASKGDEAEAEKEKSSPDVRPPHRTAERISYIHQTPARYWTTVSEDVSDAFPTARNSLATVGMETPQGRGSLALPTPSFRDSYRSSIGRRSSYVRDSVVSGMTNLSVKRNSLASSTRRDSRSTEVWGLGQALEEEDELESLPDPELSPRGIPPRPRFFDERYEGYDVEAGGDGGLHPVNQAELPLAGVAEEGEDELESMTSDALTGDHGDDSAADDEDTELESLAEKKSWPLPMGHLKFDSAVSIVQSNRSAGSITPQMTSPR